MGKDHYLLILAFDRINKLKALVGDRPIGRKSHQHNVTCRKEGEGWMCSTVFSKGTIVHGRPIVNFNKVVASCCSRKKNDKDITKCYKMFYSFPRIDFCPFFACAELLIQYIRTFCYKIFNNYSASACWILDDKQRLELITSASRITGLLNSQER